MDHAKRDRQGPAEPDPAGHVGRVSQDKRRSTRARRAVTGAGQVAGLPPALLESLALRRAHRGSVAKSGDHYFDHGFPMPGYLTDTLNSLADTGLLALGEADQCLRRVSLTKAGLARYAELPDTPRQTSAGTPAATPAGCQPGCPEPLPAPDHQPNPTALTSTAEQLQWARDPTDGQLHLLTSAAVTAATSRDHAHALCAHPIPTYHLAITYGSPTSLCAACLAAVP